MYIMDLALTEHTKYEFKMDRNSMLESSRNNTSYH